ncbi:MAG TPA: hypothetical protein VM287_04430 [Egibacteraceae bacterium]|nr:hypothetical protein [Egibacteraceae bacterium]
MNKPPRWPQRLASLMAMLNVVYIVVVLGLVGAVITALWRGLDTGELEWIAGFGAAVALAYLIAGLVIGLAIGSPLLTWLTVLAIGLWRARRWAAIAGAITFSVTAASMVLLVTAAEDRLVVTAVEGDAPSPVADPTLDPQAGSEFFVLFASAVLAGPSLLGLLLIAYSHLPATTQPARPRPYKGHAGRTR